MSKATGSKASIDKNSSFARFALNNVGKTISVNGQTADSVHHTAEREVVLVHWLSCDRAQNNFRRVSGHDDRPNSF